MLMPTIAEMLSNEEWAALVRAGYITPDYEPLQEACEIMLTEYEKACLAREMKKRPKGRYASYVAGGPEPGPEAKDA